MDILHVLPSFDSGGLGSLGLELIRAWPTGKRSQVNHYAIAPHFPRATRPVLLEEYKKLCKATVEVPRHMVASPVDYVTGLQDAVTKFGAQFGGVVAYNFIDAVWTAMGIGRAGYRGRIIQHVGTVLPNEARFRGIVQSPYTENVKFLPASETVRQALVALETPPARLASTVWNGVDLTLYPAKASPALNDPPYVRYGFTGRMAPGAKDWDALFLGFKAAHTRNPNSRLLIAGDGPLRAELEQQAKFLGFSIGTVDHAKGPDVVFMGNLAPMLVRAFLGSLDVFVMAALPIEGMSMALVEAIAARKAIVATDAPANVEVLGGLGFEPMQWMPRTGLGPSLIAAQDQAVRARWIDLAKHAAPRLDIRMTAKLYAEFFE